MQRAVNAGVIMHDHTVRLVKMILNRADASLVLMNQINTLEKGESALAHRPSIYSLALFSGEGV